MPRHQEVVEMEVEVALQEAAVEMEVPLEEEAAATDPV